MPFLATVNVPGYSPMDDDPPVFDSAQDAWQYLRDERETGEDGYESDADDYSQTHRDLDLCAGNVGSARVAWADLLGSADGQGTIYGPTPGYTGSHDLGLAYSVSVVEEEVAQ